MRYLLSITLMIGSGLLLFANIARAQGAVSLGERLGNRTEALMEMSRIGQVYQSTDLLSYNISYDFADSVALSVSLEHKEGKYGLYNNMFWGMIDSTREYMQGQQYYVVADHDTKSIYVYDKLNYSRVINIPLLDSMFNEVSLQDLLLTRPGGIYKKLTIQYLPNNQYKQIEMVYDSTTFLLTSIAYYYNAAVFSQAYYNCMDTVTALAIPATGVSMPSTVTCATLSKVYRNFLAEFPNHTKGGTVRLFKADLGVARAEQVGDADLAVNERTGPQESKEIPELWIVPQSAASTGKPVRDTVPSPPSGKRMMAAALLATGSWVDSTMSAMKLFEWYMSEHLAVVYPGEVYVDWLVNTCGYKLNQLPWNETTIVRQDTLQNIWNRFVARYPTNLTTISETVSVPVIKGVVSSSEYANDYDDLEYINAMTWTNGGWYTRRAGTTYDLSVLPRNATIQSSSLNLWANKPSWFFSAHFRYANQYPFMQLQALKGIYIPNKSTFSQSPATYAGVPVVNLPYLTTNQVSSGSSGDFWSLQDYPNQNVQSLVVAMYNNLQTTGINYPVQYKMNDESGVYKAFFFGGADCSIPGRRPTLNVAYIAGRCDVFTAFVNKALGTYLSYDQVRELYKFTAKLDLNSNCTAVTPGLGCEGDPGRPITGVTTIRFTKTDETQFDLNLFNESRFFYKTGEVFNLQSMYSTYSIVPVLGGN